MPPELLAQPQPPTRKGHAKRARALTEAIQLQKLLFRQAMEGQAKPLELSSLARVWCELEETKRKLRMKPLPKPIDVTKTPKQSRRQPKEFREPEGIS